jgi:two-component system, LytTR family, response regulator
MKIRALIIDDELLARKLIRRLLAGEEGIEVVGECADGHEAVSTIAKVLPDLIFLDVQMPELGGFEVLAQIDPAHMPVVIFVTAYDKFALKAFEANAIDYLLKPLDDERFGQALQRARTYLNGKGTGAVRDRLIGLIHQLPPQTKLLSRLAVKADGRVVFLKVAEIDWIEATGNYLALHVGKESYLLRGRLSEMEKKLSTDQFFRIHRSTIVNLDRVKEFRPLFKGEGMVVLKDGAQLAASRSYAQKLQEFLEAQL